MTRIKSLLACALCASILSTAAGCPEPRKPAIAPRPPLAILVDGDDVSVFGLAETLRRCGMEVTRVAASAGSNVDLASIAGGRGSSRLVLVGVGDGAAVAAKLALYGSPGVKVDAVVGIGGTYELPDGLAGARADVPSFLLLSPSEGDARQARTARVLARALEKAGASGVESYVVPQGEDPRPLITSFAVTGPTPQPLEGPWGVKQRWSRTPPLAHEAFWANERLVVDRPIDGAFQVALTQIFGEVMSELNPWPMQEYKALPLAAYLASRTPDAIGRGDHLVVTNIRGEQLYLTRSDVERHAPVVVIGIDDERNLYRLFTSYRLRRATSWKPDEGPMPTMIRPLGPFLHFPGGVPPHLHDTTLATFSLTPESFRWTSDDPIAVARSLSPELRETLIGGDGCLKCHAVRGAGAHAHHVRASDGKPHGGFALPLDEYPRDVLHRFLFDQETVAAGFGVTPLRVSPSAAKALYAFVVQK